MEATHTGTRIRTRMSELDITVNRLAETTAIPRMTLTRRLQNPTTFTIAEIERVAAALDVTTVWVLTGTRYAAHVS